MWLTQRFQQIPPPKFFAYSLITWLLAIFMAHSAQAQSLDTKGTEFWLGFPMNHVGSGVEPSFFLSSEEFATVTIEIPSLDYSEQYFVDPYVALKVNLPNSVITRTYNEVVNQGIKVNSDSDVTVYGLSRLRFTTDAFVSLPNDVIGTEYIVLAWGRKGSSLNGPSQFLIVATEEETAVTIVATDSADAQSITELMLSEGEAYQFKNVDGSDVSGSQIFSSKPIALFAGHECANIPSDAFYYCDHVIEQIPPTSAWGQQFVTAPLANRRDGDTFRIIASEDNTEVTINNASETLLNRGDFIERQLEGASYVEASAPIMLFQYSNGTTWDNVTSDPFEMMIPPYEQFLDSYTFATPTEGFRENFANVVVKTTQASQLKLDNQYMSSSAFREIEGTEFSYAQVALSPGSHTLEGAVSGLFVYGYDQDDSYGYPGGLSLSQVAEVEEVSLLENFDLVEGDACFTALITDNLGEALQDIRVDFTIHNLEELLDLYDRTNNRGEATVCIDHVEKSNEYRVSAAVGDNTVEVTATPVVTSSSESDDNTENNRGGGCTVGGTNGIDPVLALLTAVAIFRINRRKLCTR